MFLMKNKETVLLVVIAFIAGLLVGVLLSKGGKGSSTAPPPVASPAPVVNHQKEIALLEKIVAGEPANRQAWVKLGHNYFDSDQPMKAIEAYAKALELDARDADVLTDQGIMFRRVGWYDRAIDNFIKAGDINPNHAQSLYNLGIVYRYDVQDFAKAKEVWTRFLELNPTGPSADQIRRELQFIEAHPAGAPSK